MIPTRRRTSALLAAAAMACCVQAGAAVAEDTLRIAIPFGFDQPNPDPAMGWNAWRTSEAGLTETLFWLNQDLQLEPRLAESATSLEPDLWEVVLKDGVIFHDGTPLTAEAVRFSFDRVIDPESPVYNERIASLIGIESVEVVDDRTVRIATTEPNAAFLNDLVDPGLAILSPATTADRFYGTGPFVLDRVVPGESIDAVRFDGYWGGAAALDRIRLLTIPDPATVMLALESGDIDVAANFPDTDIARVRDRDDLTVQAMPTGRVMFFFLQVNSGPLADLRVRQAINLLMPREEIVDTVLNGLGGAVGVGIFQPTAPWANAALLPVPYDPEGALRLLAEAGIADSDGDGLLDRDGAPFRLVVRSYHGRPSMQPSAELFLARLREHGIESELQVLRDWTVAVDDFREGRADMLMFSSNAAPTGNPAYFPNFTFRSGALENFGAWSNAEFDALVAEGMRSFDAGDRKRIFDRIQQIVYDELPVTIAFYKNRLAVWRNHVQNFTLHPADIYLITNRVSVSH